MDSLHTFLLEVAVGIRQHRGTHISNLGLFCGFMGNPSSVELVQNLRENIGYFVGDYSHLKKNQIELVQKFYTKL